MKIHNIRENILNTCIFEENIPVSGYTIFDLFAVDATCFGLNDLNHGLQRNSCKLYHFM